MDNQPPKPAGQPQNQNPTPPSSKPKPTGSYPTPNFGAPSSGPAATPSSTSSTQTPSSSTPTASTPPPYDFSAGSGEPKKKRKGLVIGLIIAAVLVLLGGGGVWAYTWYQTPERVVTDSMVKAIMAKSVKYSGSFSSEGEFMKLKVELNGANTLTSGDIGGKITVSLMGSKEVTLDTNARFDADGNAYAKLSNLDKVVTELTAGVAPEMLTTLNKIVAKINNQWVKITPDNLASVNPEAAKIQKCTSEALKKYQNDKEALKEVSAVYDKNKFIKVSKELGMKDGNLGYELTGDKEAAKNFGKEVQNTKIVKSLQECNPELKPEEQTSEADQPAGDEETAINAKAELWVNMWTHEIQKVHAESSDKDGKNKSSLEMAFEFNKEVNVTAPENSISLEQLQADIDALVQEAEASAQLQAQDPAMLEAQLEADLMNEA